MRRDGLKPVKLKRTQSSTGEKTMKTGLSLNGLVVELERQGRTSRLVSFDVL